MALNRNQFAAELEPGLNALWGLAYEDYAEQWPEIFETNTSEKAFEEDVLLTGFGAAPIKAEGAPVVYDDAAESYLSRYNHETIALAFAITEEAEEDNLYGSLGQKYIKAMARSMNHTKEVKGANILNNGFNASFAGGDGVELFSTAHPVAAGGTQSNELATSADLNETSLETLLIQISELLDDRNINIAAVGTKLVLPPSLQFTGERLLESALRTATADNDINAIKSLGRLPKGFCVNQRLTDPDAWFVMTDCPDGMKHFQRIAIKNGMEGDFETGNLRYKVRERYSFGFTDWRGCFGSPGS